MAYTKQNFTDGTILMAQHLNTIENQVAVNADHNHDTIYDAKGAANTAEANAKVYADTLVSEALTITASQTWVTEQIQAAINVTWEASY